MQIDQLRPNVIVTGPIFSEAVQILIVTPMGASVKLIGQGLNTNQVHQLILNSSQIWHKTIVRRSGNVASVSLMRHKATRSRRNTGKNW